MFSSPQARSTPGARTTGLHFLTLPAELRIQIYELIFLSGPSDLAVLRACSQINMEAQSTFYQRRLTFTSQSSLFVWVERSRSSNLKRVRTMTLELTDIDLSHLLSHDRRSTHSSAWDLYQRELERLDHALMALPNIIELTVAPPKASHSQLLRGMYLSFLALITRRYPKLKRLVVEDSEAVLGKVPTLRDLASLICTIRTRPSQEGHAATEEPPTKQKYAATGIADQERHLAFPAEARVCQRGPVHTTAGPRRTGAAATGQGKARVCKGIARVRRVAVV